MHRKVIITGTMGAGKSSVLNALKAKGLPVVKECARTILAEQRSFSGHGVPEDDPNLFCELLLSRTLCEYKNQVEGGITIFDRGLPDIIAYADLFNLDLAHYQQCAQINRHHPKVFILEPWEEIYQNDEERKMTFEQAKEFHHTLVKVYESLSYKLSIVPKCAVSKRAQFILSHIEDTDDIK